MWKLIFSEATNIGTGCNREPRFGEFSRYKQPSECACFNVTPSRYCWNGSGIEEIEGWLDDNNRLAAFKELKLRIIAKRQEKNEADFSYLGNTFVSDEANIQGVKVGIEGLPDSDPIPTFEGEIFASTWISADNQFVPFNCGTFRTFADFYLKHRSKNFTNYTKLTIAATMAYAAVATVEEMQNFDITEGWD